VIDDEPTLVIPEIPVAPTRSRRERRLDRRRSRRVQMIVGWFGYAVSVCAVIAGAAWLAVRAGAPVPPTHAHVTTRTTSPDAALTPVTTAVTPRPETVAVPPPPTAETQPPAPTTTTSPIVTAVATPTP
jgi:hypothetical protein